MPYNPKYTISDKILNNLTTITSAREVIEQAYLVLKWEVRLRRQALLHNTHSSTVIEGNKLSLEQVEALFDGKDVTATNKDKQEVLNCIEALEKIPAFAEKGKIKVADLLKSTTYPYIIELVQRRDIVTGYTKPPASIFNIFFYSKV